MLVDLLLELNVINVKDIDVEINRLTARLIDPRAKRWFKRVPRYFLINIDRLLKEPYVAQAEPRSIRGSKYHAKATGGWEPAYDCESPGRTVPPRAAQKAHDPDEAGARFITSTSC